MRAVLIGPMRDLGRLRLPGTDYELTVERGGALLWLRGEERQAVLVVDDPRALLEALRGMVDGESPITPLSGS